MNYIKKESKYADTDESTQNFFFGSKSQEIHERKAVTEKINHIFTQLEKLRDKRIIKIFKLRYLSSDKLTWKSIADQFNLTPQTVITLHGKGRRFLKKKLDQ